MRLDKFFSEMGLLTRTECARRVRRGEITVNGLPADRPDRKIDPARDAVALAGEPVRYQQYRYLMMNKPAGVLSATEDGRGETVLDLLPDNLRRLGLFPCGRLDRDTTGFLLLTNDGPLAHRLLSPKHHVRKSYAYTLRDPLAEPDRAHLCAGIDIGEKAPTAPAAVEPDASGRAGIITITEGKYHQIKRMFAAVGNEITSLSRVRFGGLELDATLAPGAWRPLTGEEEETLHRSGDDGRTEKE